MKLHHKLANAFGYDLIRSDKNHLKLFSHLQQIFSRLQINCVLDVGGNVGQYGKKLRSSGYKGDIFTFEPIQSVFRDLCQISAHDKKWHVFNFALGRESGHKQIHVGNDTSFSSFLKANAYCAERFYDTTFDALEKVTVYPLDDVLPDIIKNIKTPNIFLKMDTQGYDVQVFQGSEKSLEHIKALQSEVAAKPLYEQMPDYLSALSIYQKSGFDITGLFPVSRDKHSLSIIEFDCVMVKSA